MTKKDDKKTGPNEAAPEKKKNTAVVEIPDGDPGEQTGGDAYRPMAVKDPDLEDRIEALEARVKVLEAKEEEHDRYHFGRKLE